MNFKSDDRVVCNSTNGMTTFLTPGNIYEVISVDTDGYGDEYIEVKTDVGTQWTFPIGLFSLANVSVPSKQSSNQSLLRTSTINISDSSFGGMLVDAHKGHEVVDSEANGKVFKYCRQCKVEA